MTSRIRVNLASALVLVAAAAVGGLMAQAVSDAGQGPFVQTYTPTSACVVYPQVRVRPVGLVNEP